MQRGLDRRILGMLYSSCREFLVEINKGMDWCEDWTWVGLVNSPEKTMTPWMTIGNMKSHVAEWHLRGCFVGMLVRFHHEPKTYHWFVGGREGIETTITAAKEAVDDLLRRVGFVDVPFRHNRQ